MRIALSADERCPVHAILEEELARRGHEVVRFGALHSGSEEPWVDCAEQAALAVARGDCDEGIFSCYTGTGISIAANKVAGIRAALCVDAATASGARIWNHANVLCLSHRLLSNELAREILESWFATERGERGTAGVRRLSAVEKRHRKS